MWVCAPRDIISIGACGDAREIYSSNKSGIMAALLVARAVLIHSFSFFLVPCRPISLSLYVLIYLSVLLSLSLLLSLSHALSFLSIPIYLHPFCSPIAIYMPCYFLSSHPRSSRASPSSSRVAPSSSKVAPSSASEAPNSSMAAPSLVGAFSKIAQHHGCDSVPPPPPTSLAHPSHLPHLSLSPPTPHALCPLSSIPHPS